MREKLQRAALSVALCAMPLLAVPPWVHVEPVAPFFANRTFGEFDRHAPRWRPPFSAEVAANPGLTFPVRVDLERLSRELLVTSATVYGCLTLLHRARRATRRGSWVAAVDLPRLSALIALLLPIPPVGILALAQWEAVTDWNHGVPALLPYAVYWLLLSVVTFAILGTLRRVHQRFSPTAPAS